MNLEQFPLEYEMDKSDEITALDVNELLDVLYNQSCGDECKSINSFLEGLESLKSKHQHSEGEYSNPLCNESTSGRSCIKSQVNKVLLGYMYPLILAICIFGNAASLLAYSSKNMRKSTTVKMLMAKFIMNTLFMICIFPHSLIIIGNDSSFSINLWASWPFMLCLVNVNGTCATWITVFLTLERYVFVTWPMKSKQWSTTKNFVKAFLVTLWLAILLHVAIPATHYVESTPCGSNKFVHQLFVRNETLLVAWESCYYFLHLIVSLFVPNTIIAVLSLLLSVKLLRTMLPHYSERKRCVTRISLATMFCHLTLEAPAICVYAVAALHGPSFVNENRIMCIAHVVVNFANQLNASVCFITYMVCSDKFRTMLIQKMGSLICGKYWTVVHSAPASQTHSAQLPRKYNDEQHFDVFETIRLHDNLNF